MNDLLAAAGASGIAAQLCCQRLLCELLRCMDRREGLAVSQFLAPSATWVRQRETIHGAAAIAATVSQRPTDRIVRHNLCNVVVTLLSAESAAAEAYYVAYTCEQTAAGRGAPVVTARVGDFRAEFVQIESEWRVSSLRAVRLFEHAAPAQT